MSGSNKQQDHHQDNGVKILDAMKQKGPQKRPGFKVRTTKFRHLQGHIPPKQFHITNITGLCKTVPGKCDGFKANERFCAFIVGISGNQLAIVDLQTKEKRQSGGVMPSLVCGNNKITDFAFDPFNFQRVAVGCDNGCIRIWDIPLTGLKESLEEPDITLTGHMDRISIIQFHPSASDVLATAAFDFTIKIWDIKNVEEKITISGHEVPIFGMAWSPDGRLLAAFCKDSLIRVYNPRSDDKKPVKETNGPAGARGGRICWANDGTQLIVSGFSKISERQILVYDYNNFNQPISTEGIDVNPSILIPHYDEDSSTLFLFARGDSTVYAFEISSLGEGAPYIHELSHFKCQTPHQSVCFLNKKSCDVKMVQFAIGYRLTKDSVEPISFTVPRLRSEYFQDDLFPQTKVTWEPSLSSTDWFNGQNGITKYVDLRPSEMINLSEAPPPPSKKKPDKPSEIMFDSDAIESSLAFMVLGKEKREQLVESMSQKVGFRDDSLPQEDYEGVDPDEWVS